MIFLEGDRNVGDFLLDENEKGRELLTTMNKLETTIVKMKETNVTMEQREA